MSEIYTSGIKKDAGNLREFVTSLENDYKSIFNSLNNLKTGWVSEEAVAKNFFKGMDDVYLPELKTAIDLLNNYPDFLDNVPGAYKTLDESYANKKIDV